MEVTGDTLMNYCVNWSQCASTFVWRKVFKEYELGVDEYPLYVQVVFESAKWSTDLVIVRIHADYRWRILWVDGLIHIPFFLWFWIKQ
jgi:hypothetical protein